MCEAVCVCAQPLQAVCKHKPRRLSNIGRRIHNSHLSAPGTYKESRAHTQPDTAQRGPATALLGQQGDRECPRRLRLNTSRETLARHARYTLRGGHMGVWAAAPRRMHRVSAVTLLGSLLEIVNQVRHVLVVLTARRLLHAREREAQAGSEEFGEHRAMRGEGGEASRGVRGRGASEGCGAYRRRRPSALIGLCELFQVGEIVGA